MRVSHWSLRLWSDVWSSKGSLKFHNCRYHEQSALLRQLARRGEGLDALDPPFHSYCGGRSTPKLFPHVAVMPRRALNTNRYDLRGGEGPAAAAGAAACAAAGLRESARAPGESAVREEDACDFIFHAAGNPTLRCIGVAGTAVLSKPDKPTAIRMVLAHTGLGPPPTPRPPTEVGRAEVGRAEGSTAKTSSAAADGEAAAMTTAACSASCSARGSGRGLLPGLTRRSSRAERAAMAELHARLGEAWARAREIGGVQG